MCCQCSLGKFMGKPLPPVMGGRKKTSTSTAHPPSPTPAAGSTVANSSPASQNTGGPAPGVLLGLSGGWLIARMFFFGGTLWLIEIIAIATMAGFAHSKGGKGQKKFAKAIIGFAILNLLFPGLNSWIKGFRESQLNPPTTEQSAGQEQVNPSPSPTPTPEVWDSTQFSDRGGILLDKPSQEISIPPDSELCMSELIDPDTGGNLLQRVTVGTDEYNTRMSKCWDISTGKISIQVGHPEGAVIGDEYKRFGGKLPVIRPK